MEKKQKRGSFSGSIGFVLAAAGSAVGLGNIWRFPYLAAKDGGGVFLLCYLILALTFGFALLTTEIAIGRKTGQSPLTAYKAMHPKMGWLGVIACAVPAMILPYYCVIGGWVLKFLSVYVTGSASAAVQEGYFDSFIMGQTEPVVWFVVYLALTVFVVYKGVGNGIEKFSTVLMPILILLIMGISLFSLTLKHTDASGVTRTGIQGFLIYVVPDFEGMTLKKFITILMDATGQLFYSVSVAMGIMITYGSYVKKDTNLVKSVNQIEIFDTLVAFLAGFMIVPAVYTFMGTEGMATGPSLMFVSLPKVFEAMGVAGSIIAIVFFIMVAFAALTSSVSIMEAIVSSCMDKFCISRKRSTVVVGAFTAVIGLVVCFGYNIWFFKLTLPNGSTGQILDVLDYTSNNILMPIVAIATCILVGWIVKPKTVIDEVTHGGLKFGRKGLYIVMVKFVVPVLLLYLLLQALGILNM
ncbi:MAG: sodium-dependent transporter [Lachnospiraceae bacterium]|nr:sodium-dependent transporter [Lachnospiraceae bacterium]